MNTRITELQAELKRRADNEARLVEAAARQAEAMERMRAEMMMLLCSRLGVPEPAPAFAGIAGSNNTGSRGFLWA